MYILIDTIIEEAGYFSVINSLIGSIEMCSRVARDSCDRKGPGTWRIREKENLDVYSSSMDIEARGSHVSVRGYPSVPSLKVARGLLRVSIGLRCLTPIYVSCPVCSLFLFFSLFLLLLSRVHIIPADDS